MTRGAALLADVGGTNARFALCDAPGKLLHEKTLQVAEFASFDDALKSYLAGIGQFSPRVRRAVVAAAGPVQTGGQVVLTNSPWRISQDEISRTIDGPARVLNDVEAVALELPHSSHADLQAIGPVIPAAASGNLLAVNVGTGFGASVAVHTGDNAWSAIATEAGHMSYCARAPEELALGAAITTVEDFLSGEGLVRAYLGNLKGAAEPNAGPQMKAADVFALAGRDPAATQVIDAFSAALARVASDLVLATGSWGGAFFCGSVARAWAEKADLERFREFFVGQGKMADRLRLVPTQLLRVREPALMGLSRTVG